MAALEWSNCSGEAGFGLPAEAGHQSADRRTSARSPRETATASFATLLSPALCGPAQGKTRQLSVLSARLPLSERLDAPAQHDSLAWDTIPILHTKKNMKPHGGAHSHASRQQPAHVTHFIHVHKAEAQAVSARTGIPVEVILAQSALESDWGRKIKGSAYFGIKGKSATANSTVFTTHEVDLAGKRVAQ
jgi:flagellum-specific peptidoglycan hydrolase FlgJ